MVEGNVSDKTTKMLLATGDDLVPNAKLETKWGRLNTAIGGGMPLGRVIEIYGPSQIGKSSIALQMFPERTSLYFDVDRKIDPEYAKGVSDTVKFSRRSGEDMFDSIEGLMSLGIVFVIDSLPNVGPHLKRDKDRLDWLTSRFMRIQRLLLRTDSIIIIINQIRINPGTQQTYSPHCTCVDPAIKLMLHTAERRGKDKLIYVDVKKSFWGHEGERCTLLVTKTEVKER